VRYLLPFLNTHYKDSNKAQELVELGNISRLCKEYKPADEEHSFNNPQEGVTVFYGRDRGETGQQAKRHNSWQGAIDTGSYDDCLIYSDGKWDVVEHDQTDHSADDFYEYVSDRLSEWKNNELIEQVISMGDGDWFQSWEDTYVVHCFDKAYGGISIQDEVKGQIEVIGQMCPAMPIKCAEDLLSEMMALAHGNKEKTKAIKTAEQEIRNAYKELTNE